jgi:hypothetical protein
MPYNLISPLFVLIPRFSPTGGTYLRTVCRITLKIGRETLNRLLTVLKDFLTYLVDKDSKEDIFKSENDIKAP